VSSVLVASGSPLALDGLKSLLQNTEFTLVASCRNGVDVLECLSTARPKILLLDFDLPGISGVEILRKLRETEQMVAVILIKPTLRGADVLKAFRLGVKGLVRDEPSEILRCLYQVNAGEHWIDPLTVTEVLEHANDAGSADAAVTLTERECEMVRLVARGLKNKQIALELAISEGTVKMHLHNIYVKLGLKGRTHLALFALHNDRSHAN
jgi:two-component system nitrate/nitrite response regulator NarL